MKTVPKGKIILVGGRRFIEGDILPPFVSYGIPVMTKEEVKEVEAELIRQSEPVVKTEEQKAEKPKPKRGRPKKR